MTPQLHLAQPRRVLAAWLAVFIAVFGALAPTVSHALVWSRGGTSALTEVCISGATVGKNEIEHLQLVNNLLELGKRVPGISMVRNMRIPDGGKLYTENRIDGMRAVSTNTSVFDEVDMANIDRIDVITGPGSALYGSGALGGTISLYTRQPPKDFAAKLSQEIGSYGFARTQANVGTTTADERGLADPGGCESDQPGFLTFASCSIIACHHEKIFLSRHSLIAGSVVLLHLGALWLLQTGLNQRAVAAVLPVEILSELIEPPVPKNVPPPPAARKPVWQPATRKTAAPPPPPPMPIALADPTPAPNAPVGDVHEPVAMAPLPAPMATTPGPPAPSASPHIELPSSDADYLHNPKPAYPANSRRLGEQGKVIVRVLIGSDGTAQKAEVRQSSGFERLDLAALATVQRWRYVPGKRGGMPETMWFSVPVNFVLE